MRSILLLLCALTGRRYCAGRTPSKQALVGSRHLEFSRDPTLDEHRVHHLLLFITNTTCGVQLFPERTHEM
jgi:hypothetical protein